MTTILVVEDDAALREAMRDTLAMAGHRVTDVESAAAAIETLSCERFDLIVSDVQMNGMSGHELLAHAKREWPETPFVLMTAFGSIEQAVSAIQSGATDYLSKPFEASVLLELADRFAGGAETTTGPIVEDERSAQCLRLAERVAGSDATVMISGESGSGKEVFARFIHDNSLRAAGPFVAINCAAIPETMLESILFGYEKGAFTGAYKSKEGKFEQANGGTLLLDEISEMDIALQAKLLRVLQEREVERLGGSRSIPLDVRVVATTNRNLREEVREGNFREDLYYRLNVFPMCLPALRERPGDILPLARHFANRFAVGEAVTLSQEATAKLVAHRWPGNVRELENVMQRAMILKAGSEIDGRDICFEEATGGMIEIAAEPAVAEAVESPSLESDMKRQEYSLIMDAIRTEGSKQGAAERLGISPRTLRYKLARFKKEGMAASA